MKSWKKYIKALSAGLLGGVTLALVIGYITAQYALNKKYQLPLSSFKVPADTTMISHGKHLTRILGCEQCHGQKFEGKLVHDGDEGPFVGDVYSGNLSKTKDSLTPTDFERAIRFGIKKDKTFINQMMPFRSYYHLNDYDLKSIIAHIKSVPETDNPQLPEQNMHVKLPGKIFGGWFFILTKGSGPLAPVNTDTTRPRINKPQNQNLAGKGKYLATLSCTKCHGMDFTGSNPNWDAPNLAIIASYDLKDFKKLMRTGKALGNRDLGYMSELARNQFKYLTDQEVESIYRFFQDRIDK